MKSKNKRKLTRTAFLKTKGKKLLQLDTLKETEELLTEYALRKHISSGRKVAALILDKLMSLKCSEEIITKLLEELEGGTHILDKLIMLKNAEEIITKLLEQQEWSVK